MELNKEQKEAVRELVNNCCALYIGFYEDEDERDRLSKQIKTLKQKLGLDEGEGNE